MSHPENPPNIFTLTFFKEEYKNALRIAGTISGNKVEDKWTECGLHPYYVDGTTAVEEAEMIFVCRKLYAQDMKPECFIDVECDTKNYPTKDYHTMYIAKIKKVYKKV